MDLHLTSEQSILVDTFARMFAERSQTSDVRRAEPLGHDPELWRQLVELGAPTARVSEAHGGLGLGLREVALIANQAGYRIASVPLVECIVAAKVLAEVGSTESLAHLERVASGTQIVALALHPVSPDEPHTVPGGAVAQAVVAYDGERLVLLGEGARSEPHRRNLGSYPLARWKLEAAHTRVLAEGPRARELFESAVEEWKLLTAACLSGICSRALEYAAEYSTEREAFGIKIGAFQGLSHPLADCATANDGAKLLNDFAIWKLEQRSDAAAAYISMAYWWATETCASTMPQCVHIFGGYGVSLEHDIQLFARRGMALISVFGDRQGELLEVAQRLWGGREVSTPAAGTSGLDFSLGESAVAMGQRVRAFFARTLTAEHAAQRGHSWDSFDPAVYQKLAEAELLFPHWPKEWGGLEASPAEQFAIREAFYECPWTDYPQGVSAMVAEIVRHFGSDELKEEVLPRIKSGSALCCLGFTEPHCGSDVFEAKTSARRKGDGWLINGQKMFTSGANIARYVLLLTSTSPDKPKHAGKTMFLVPMNLPGVEVQRVDTISDDRTHITYYTDVELPDRYRVGLVDAGAKVMGHILKLEQGGVPSGFEFKRMLSQALAWALKRRGGKRRFDEVLVQLRLATAITDLTIAELMLLRITESREKHKPVRHYGSMLKAFVCEAWKKDSAALMDMAAPASLFTDDEELSRVERGWRSSLASAIYGGTTQVHRSVVAEIALGMPRSR